MTKRRAPLKRKKPLFSHRRHSGKRLPHHHTHFLTLLFFVVFSGFLLAGISHSADAADIVVKAKISAPLPPFAAEITSPIGGTDFTSIPIEVQGTCPAGYLIKLFRNDVFSGSVICAIDNTFSMQSDLFSGSNDLIARVYNITDDEGPVLPAVTVTYTPPVVLPPSGLNPNTPTLDGRPSTPVTGDVPVPQFILRAESTYKGFAVGNNVEWRIEVQGGTNPYALNIDWGDGESDVIVRKQAGDFIVHHTYERADSFVIRVTGSDDSGQAVFMQLAAIENALLRSGGIGQPVTTLPVITLSPQLIAWICYIAVLIAVSSFWFGEIWRIRHLPRQFTPSRRRPHRA